MRVWETVKTLFWSAVLEILSFAQKPFPDYEHEDECAKAARTRVDKMTDDEIWTALHLTDRVSDEDPYFVDALFDAADARDLWKRDGENYWIGLYL